MTKKNKFTSNNRRSSRSRGIRMLALFITLALAVNTFTACGSYNESVTDSDAAESLVGSEELFEGTESESSEEMEDTESAEDAETIATAEAVETEMSAGTKTVAESETETDTETESGKESQIDSDTAAGYTFTSMSKTMYAKKSVNVRDLPSTDGEKIGSLSKGDSVAVTGQCEETGWYRIIYNGKTGYCSNNYLSTTKPSSSSSSGNSGSSSGDSGGSSGLSGSSGASGSSESSDSGSTYNTGYTQSELDAMADEVIELVNKERKAAGVKELEKDDGLMEAAAIRAKEQEELFGHTRPDGTSCDTILDELGITDNYGGIGIAENAAYGQISPEDVMDSWMNSSGHRANILAEDYDYIGVGVYYSSTTGRFYWIQIFNIKTCAKLYEEHEANGTHRWLMRTAIYTGTSTFGICGESGSWMTIDLVEGETYYRCIDCGKQSHTADGGTIIQYTDDNFDIYDYITGEKLT